jgi:Fanconi-associated nuclease 1
VALPAAEDEAVKTYETARSKSGAGTYSSSIYVDAFNYALDTVLKDEAYLFSDEEAEVFAKYRSLDYEAQYLYVRLAPLSSRCFFFFFFFRRGLFSSAREADLNA